MSYGNTHTETIPTVSSTAGPTFATQINAVLAEIRTSLNAKVTPAGIDVNTDLSMRSGATRYGLTDIHRLSMYAQPSGLAAATYPAALWVDTSGNLYYNNTSSNQVQVTSGSSVNGTPGSITGSGYGSAGVALNWNAASTIYEFFRAASTYSDVEVSGVRLNDATSHYARLIASSMSANWTCTFPAAAASSGFKPVWMDSTGLLSVGHASKTLTVPACLANTRVNAANNWSVETDGLSIKSTASGTAWLYLPLREGEQITSVTFAVSGDGVADLTTTVYKISGTTTPVTTDIGNATTNNPGAIADVTINVTDTTLAANECIAVRFDANAADLEVYATRVTYNIPA
jgi:hypothetical protein